MRELWSDEDGQAIAESAVMLAVILVIVMSMHVTQREEESNVEQP